LIACIAFQKSGVKETTDGCVEEKANALFLVFDAIFLNSVFPTIFSFKYLHIDSFAAGGRTKMLLPLLYYVSKYIIEYQLQTVTAMMMLKW